MVIIHYITMRAIRVCSRIKYTHKFDQIERKLYAGCLGGKEMDMDTA